MDFGIQLVLYATLFVVILYKIIDALLRVPMLGKYEEIYILITGCDTGFGHEAAKRLDEMGCHVFAACLTEKGRLSLQTSCSERLHTLYMDVTKSSTINEAFKYVNDRLPKNLGLWALLNNAGVFSSTAPIDWLEQEDYQKVLNVNLLGLIDVTKTFLPLLRRSRGRIVNTSSVAGLVSYPGSTPYNISKFGVEAFSDALRRQVWPFGVSVHVIEPSEHKTNIVADAQLQKWSSDLWEKYENASDESKIYYNKAYVERNIKGLTDFFSSFVLTAKPVVDAYIHAALGYFPRTRYLVCSNKFKRLIKMPTPIADWVINRDCDGNYV